MEVNFAIEGLKFMFLGMTTVFLFLLLMIYVLKLQAKLVSKYFPPKPASVAPVKAVSSKAETSEDEEIIAAITAAITEYKKG